MHLLKNNFMKNKILILYKLEIEPDKNLKIMKQKLSNLERKLLSKTDR